MIFSARLEQMTCDRRASHQGSENRLPHQRIGEALRNCAGKKVLHPARGLSFKTTCYGVYLLLWVLAIRMADQRAFEHGIVVAIYRHANRLAIFHVVSAAQIFSPCSL